MISKVGNIITKLLLKGKGTLALIVVKLGMLVSNVDNREGLQKLMEKDPREFGYQRVS